MKCEATYRTPCRNQSTIYAHKYINWRMWYSTTAHRSVQLKQSLNSPVIILLAGWQGRHVIPLRRISHATGSRFCYLPAFSFEPYLFFGKHHTRHLPKWLIRWIILLGYSLEFSDIDRTATRFSLVIRETQTRGWVGFYIPFVMSMDWLLACKAPNHAFYWN